MKKDAVKIAKKAVPIAEQKGHADIFRDFLIVMDFISSTDQDASINNRSKKIESYGTEHMQKVWHSFLKERVTLKGLSEVQTAPDRAVDFILKINYDLTDDEVASYVDHHRKAMSVENILGKLLERFISSKLSKLGWVTFWRKRIVPMTVRDSNTPISIMNFKFCTLVSADISSDIYSLLFRIKVPTSSFRTASFKIPTASRGVWNHMMCITFLKHNFYPSIVILPIRYNMFVSANYYRHNLYCMVSQDEKYCNNELWRNNYAHPVRRES